MKLVILAGGFGTRISEESESKPKPMINIGQKPILWHIMKYYSHFGIEEFIICAGYRAYQIKEYFSNYHLHNSDLVVSLKDGKIETLETQAENWKVTVVDTGLETMTGGRIKRIQHLLGDDQKFLLTYGDGLSDVNISKLIKQNHEDNVKATVTAVQPPTRFGNLEIVEGNLVKQFIEKPDTSSSVSGGFFVLHRDVIDLIKDDSTIWEEGPLAQLAAENELSAYQHTGFWQPMDTLREQKYLEKLWNEGQAPWQVW